MALNAMRHTRSALDALAIDQVDSRRFVSGVHPGEARRSYGGEVAGQAVLAAGRTVPAERLVHAIQTYFLRPGDTTVPTDYVVEDVRDGGSFTTRRVEASQKGRIIFTMLASFHTPEDGLAHQLASIEAPGPDALPTPEETFADSPENLSWSKAMLDSLGVDARFATLPARAHASYGLTADPHQSVWLRSRETIPDDPLEQAACLTYLTDLMLLSAALGPHGRTLQDGTLQFATINHSVWFHAPIRVDDWFFYDQSSRWAGNARALSNGEILDAAGRLCATTVQEGLLRVR